MIEVYHTAPPVVSVIMPTYNRIEFLKRSIPSFLKQTFSPAELIVVDDGSNDNSFQIVNGYLNAHSNIRYLKHSNRRPSLSRNAGILAAVGKYIAFLDSDDEYKPDYLERRIQFMETHPDIDLVEGGVEVVGDSYIRDKNDRSKYIHLSECHIGASFFGKREVFIDLNGFNKEIDYSEDSDFWERAEKKFKVIRLDEPGYIYHRDDPGSISNRLK